MRVKFTVNNPQNICKMVFDNFYSVSGINWVVERGGGSNWRKVRPLWVRYCHVTVIGFDECLSGPLCTQDLALELSDYNTFTII